jgi:DNA-binding XRE family transcriptional regulator
MVSHMSQNSPMCTPLGIGRVAEVGSNSTDSTWRLRAGMDPNYHSPQPDIPPAENRPRRKPYRSEARSADRVWLEGVLDQHAARLRAELQRQLALRPAGARIRTLRAVRGWTQTTAARELGISVRTLIRHEQGHNQTRWLRCEPHIRLGELESVYAKQIIASITFPGIK